MGLNQDTGELMAVKQLKVRSQNGERSNLGRPNFFARC